VAQLRLDRLLQEGGEQPVEIEPPADDAGRDLVDERLVVAGGGRRGEMPVDGGIERAACLNFPYDREA
jgi:hypothetical protein